MERTLRYGETSIKYLVNEAPTLSDRVRIHVHPNGVVEVEAPTDTNTEKLDSAVRKRARWISNQLKTAEDARKYSLPREYVSGETHFYIGRRYRLKVIETKSELSAVRLKAGRIEVFCRLGDPAAIRRRLNNWYRERAEVYFERRLDQVASRIGWLDTKPPVKLIKMQKQWGSCAPNGVINLNPWLVRAPTECIDYVITHEICHLREHNHSKRYYELLARHYPNWRHVKARLDEMAELILAS